jgi:hypothetical protein
MASQQRGRDLHDGEKARPRSERLGRRLNHTIAAADPEPQDERDLIAEQPR